MKKYIVMLVIWASICYLASSGQSEQETPQESNVTSTQSIPGTLVSTTTSSQF